MTRRLNLSNETGLVRGIVIDNEDPEKRGRIKVRVPSYHGIPNQSRTWIDDNDLPWSTPGIFISGGNDLGQRILPTVGTRVFVMFEDGDFTKPVYFGGIPLLIGEEKIYNHKDATVLGPVSITTDDTMSDINYSKSQSSQGVLFKSLKGFTIYYDDTNGSESAKIIDQSGQMIKMFSLSPVLSRRENKEYTSGRSQILFQSGRSSLQIGDIDYINENNVSSNEEGFIFVLPSYSIGD